MQLARLDAGEIQDVVDDVQERIGGLAHGLGVIPLFGGERGLHEQVGHAHDTVQGGADLVAHVGDEFGLDAGRFQGGGVGVLEGLFGVLALGHVADDGLGDDAPVQPHGMEGDLGGEAATIGAPPEPVRIAVPLGHGLGDHASGVLGRGGAVGLELGAEIGGVHGAEFRCRSDAEHGEGRRVAVQKTLAVQEHDAVGVGVEQGLVFHLLLFQFPRLAGSAADDQDRREDA